MVNKECTCSICSRFDHWCTRSYKSNDTLSSSYTKKKVNKNINNKTKVKKKKEKKKKVYFVSEPEIIIVKPTQDIKRRHQSTCSKAYETSSYFKKLADKPPKMKWRSKKDIEKCTDFLNQEPIQQFEKTRAETCGVKDSTKEYNAHLQRIYDGRGPIFRQLNDNINSLDENISNNIINKANHRYNLCNPINEKVLNKASETHGFDGFGPHLYGP